MLAPRDATGGSATPAGQHATPRRRRHGAKHREAEPSGPLGPHLPPASPGRQTGPGASRIVGERRQMLRRPGIERFEGWPKGAKLRPREARVRVARIVQVAHPSALEKRTQGPSPAVEERPHHAIGPRRRDPRETFDTRAAERAKEHGLGLVVPRMADGHVARAAVASVRTERRIARAPRCGLKRRTSRHADLERRVVEAEAAGKARHESRLGAALGPEPMVHGRHGEL